MSISRIRLGELGTFIAIALSAFFSISAKPANKPTQKPSPDYFPLRVGDSWTYRNTEEGGYTLKVVSAEPVEGAPTRFVIELSSEVKILNTFSKADGWVRLHFERYPEHEGLEAKYDPPKQYLPDPLVAGQKWEWAGADPTQARFTEKNSVVGIEEITVPAGKFRAMKVVSVMTGGSIPKTKTAWYAEGVGLVKSTTEGGQIKYGSELADYSFKKK
jgi:hypothetical protein